MLLLITREVDYALRILRALSDNERHRTAELCERELIPQQFAYKILKKLSRAGFVSIARGTEGGSRLIVDPQTKSLADLMAAMDATELVNACMSPDYQCAWRHSRGGHCAIHTRLVEIQRAVYAELQSHSLAGLLAEQDGEETLA